MLAVLAPGPLTTVQDLGRPGHAAIASSTSGTASTCAVTSLASLDAFVR